MRRYPNLTAGFGLVLATVAIMVLVGIGAVARNPEYSLLRQAVMGWPLIVLGATSVWAGLRVAFWPEAAHAEAMPQEETHEPEPPSFRHAA